ncbi:MAG: hypothetical protein LIO94_11580, partial [Clostridiales bacterium]|nr:hypothetical protein [Clostridiales bacterium]
MIRLQNGPLGQSILNWYEFAPEASLLAIGTRAASIKELFCRRVQKVTCLSAREELPQERFDYIVVLGEPADRSEELSAEEFSVDNIPVAAVSKGNADVHGKAGDLTCRLRNWAAHLKPDGHLLVSVENRYGLKYFCGAEDPFTGVPFDGINGYLHSAAIYGRCL